MTKEKFELTLLENAIDSLDEGLSQYRAFVDHGNHRGSKFSVMFLFHYLELLLKHCVAQIEPELIYKNRQRNDMTIGISEAVKLLKENGVELPKRFETELDWIRSARNNIEHHKVDLDIAKLKDVLGHILFDSNLIKNDLEIAIDLKGHLQPENMVLFSQLSDDYEARLHVALEKISAASKKAHRNFRPKEWDQVDFKVYECDGCGEKTLMTDYDSPTGYRCTFCGEEESDEMERRCSICDQSWPNYMLRNFDNWDGNGNSEIVCPRCSGHPDYHPD